MSELLLELFSEEIPARLQTRAADDLRRLMVDGLKARGLEVGEARAFATPRRLALVIADVPKKSPAVSEERKGPRVGAPEQAVQGFLKGAGLKSLADAQDRQGREEGRLLRRAHRQARTAGARDRRRGAARDDRRLSRGPRRCASTPARQRLRELRWIRPLHSIVLLLDGKVVPFEIAGIKAGSVTRGHRFHRQRAVQGHGLCRLREGLEAATR